MNPYKPEQIIDEEEMNQRQEAQENALQMFGSSLAGTRDEWVRSRVSTGWDKRVAEDLDQYNNEDSATKNTPDMMQTVHNGFPAGHGGASKPTRSTVFIGMTRQKTNGAEARLSDILLPTDDRNFGIKPTPNPQLAKGLKDETPAANPMTGQPMVGPDGQPLQRKDLAAQAQMEAEDKAEGMQREIDDQLNECDYKGELRKVIHDAAVMGTGVVKGPIVVSRAKKHWTKLVDQTGTAVHVVEMREDRKPSSERVDPRNVYEDPSCGENIQNGRGIFERSMKTAKQVRALAKQPGYLENQIRKVLEEGPKPSAAMQEVIDKDKGDINKDLYEVWEYWGEIEPEEARAAGMEVKDDILSSVDVCVVMINSTVVKAFLSPLETGDLPYDFYPWEKVADSARGMGVPALMRSQQKIINAAWRTMMDNAGASSGPQIVMRKQGVEPADGRWELTGRKIWWATDNTVDVRTVFSTFQIDSRQQELAGIIQLATQLADEETAVPMIMQGNERAAPETVGAMQMLMNASNVVLRRLVKQFDDMITRPHIRRYYDFNMLYGEDEKIKGDYEVDARGSSALLVRDIQNQAFMNLLAAATNPVFAPMIDPKKLFEKALQAQHIDPRDIMLSDEEIEKNKKAAAEQGPQQDPRIAVAQMRAQTDQQLAQFNQQSDMAELQLKAQLAADDRDFRQRELDMLLEIEMVKLAQTKELTLDQIKARMAETTIKETNRKQLFDAEAQLKLATGQGI